MTVTSFVIIVTFIGLALSAERPWLKQEMSCDKQFVEHGVVSDVIDVAPQEKATVRERET